MQILDQLDSGEGKPSEAIRAATANRATAAPLLADAFERHETNNGVEEDSLFVACWALEPASCQQA